MVGSSFQSVDRIHFYICREEVQPELLFEFSPGLDGENASVCFLTEYVFGPLGGTTSLEEREGPGDPFLFVMELLQGLGIYRESKSSGMRDRCNILR